MKNVQSESGNPVGFSSRFVQVGDRRIHITQAGAGSTVLMLHGGCGSFGCVELQSEY